MVEPLLPTPEISKSLHLFYKQKYTNISRVYTRTIVDSFERETDSEVIFKWLVIINETLLCLKTFKNPYVLFRTLRL